MRSCFDSPVGRVGPFGVDVPRTRIRKANPRKGAAALRLDGHISETPDAREAIRTLRATIQNELRELYENLNPSDVVKVARHSARPQALDYIELVFDEFVELHGDRAFGDDRAMIAGFAKLEDQKVLVVGQHKGRTIKEREERLLGCAHPEGYRKALEKMKLAAKFRLPIICLIDTPGAYPGSGLKSAARPAASPSTSATCRSCGRPWSAS